jgi:hypothetical protein
MVSIEEVNALRLRIDKSENQINNHYTLIQELERALRMSGKGVDSNLVGGLKQHLDDLRREFEEHKI